MLAQLLPLEESFLLLFRFDNPLESSVEFMKIWREYDSDGSGFIEADELKSESCINEYQSTLIMQNKRFWILSLKQE
ncbi:calbindin-32 [Trichonephila inaurata madagascariensis]|uniref:Calbindin-32 n=1 Tax=Trichonephila inaurata madagascariensis TaxID=2747483 RepID=A0A8X6Y8P0_9ARAC|nr:calbindin-32 [Trichonephila inaurata madagascariensis]